MGPALMGFVTQIATVVAAGQAEPYAGDGPRGRVGRRAAGGIAWGVLSVLLIFLVGAVLYFGVLPRMLKKEGAGK